MTYSVLPHGGRGGNVTSSRIPIHISDTKVLSSGHELEVRSNILLILLLLTIKIKIPEVEIEELLRGNGSYNNESSLRRPVDSIVVLLVDGADELEVTERALGLLWTIEGNGGLWWGTDLDTWGWLLAGDEDEAVTLWLPSKVNNGVLQLEELDWDLLLGDPEELEVGECRLLGLGVAVDLDAKVLALGLPVKLAVGDVEQVSGSDDGLGWNGHKTDTGRLVLHLWGPVGEELLLLLSSGKLNGLGAPLEINNTLNLDGLLAQKTHAGDFVDFDGLSWSDTGEVLLVRRPLEDWPLNLSLSICILFSLDVEIGERAEESSSLEIPDKEVLALLFWAKRMWSIWQADWSVGPGNKVVLIRRVFYHVYERMVEPLDTLP